MIDVNFQVVGLTESQARFSSLPAAVRTRLRAFMASETLNLRNLVRSNIAQYFRSTGPLYQSVRSDTLENTDGITGRVYTEGVPYARIQEQGGTVQIPEISPVRAKALAFMAGGKLGFSSGGGESGGVVFAMKTKAHPVTIPEHPYAREALAYERVPFRNGIRALVQDAIGDVGMQMAAE